VFQESLRGEAKRDTIGNLCGDLEKGVQAKSEIDMKYPASVVTVKHLDLAEIQSIKSFVSQFESTYPHLNLLVNNAGILSTKKERLTTKDGFELQVGVNHLGTFLLTHLLLGSLYRGAPSRVITLSSSNLSIAKLDLDDFMMKKRLKRGDGGREQYSISKLAIAMCLRKLAGALNKNDPILSSQVKFFNVCPGQVRTELFRNETGCRRCCTCMQICAGGISPHKGSETVCYLCLSKSFSYNENCGKGEMYRFKKIWKLGQTILEKLDGSTEANKLYEMTTRWLSLDGSPNPEVSSFSLASKSISQIESKVINQKKRKM